MAQSLKKRAIRSRCKSTYIKDRLLQMLLATEHEKGREVCSLDNGEVTGIVYTHITMEVSTREYVFAQLPKSSSVTNSPCTI